MPVHDFRAQRLFVDADLCAGARLSCERAQANYLLNVLRMKAGDGILVFNGRDGEWRATVEPDGRRDCHLMVHMCQRRQDAGPDLEYLFAPLKRARLDFMVQKATELGVARLRPVITHHTQAERVNLDRMRANVIEAAEQCGILRLPDVLPPERLNRVIETWPSGRHLIFCDEASEPESPIDALSRLAPGPVAVLIGPEGGFGREERDMLLAKPETVRLSLGPRIMRADTAAIAVLALVNAVLGDWR